MSGEKIFLKSINSQFDKLGLKAVYIDSEKQKSAIRVIACLPDQMFDIGEQKILAEKSQFMVRVSEVQSPQVGDQIHSGKKVYQIESEPRLDIYQLLWTLDSVCLF